MLNRTHMQDEYLIDVLISEGKSKVKFYRTSHHTNRTTSVFAKHFSLAHLPCLNLDYNSDVTHSSITVLSSSQKEIFVYILFNIYYTHFITYV